MNMKNPNPGCAASPANGCGNGSFSRFAPLNHDRASVTLSGLEGRPNMACQADCESNQMPPGRIPTQVKNVKMKTKKSSTAGMYCVTCGLIHTENRPVCSVGTGSDGARAAGAGPTSPA